VTYRVKGIGTNGRTYEGQVTIIAVGDVYEFRWNISGHIYVGSGRLRDKIITVDWGQQYPVVYRIDDDGTLRGTWDNGACSEEAVPIR
jgi:hypothetical protein